MNDALPAYEVALATVNAASRTFAEAQKKYRAREIGDGEFLAARAAYKAAEVEFDKAYAAREVEV